MDPRIIYVPSAFKHGVSGENIRRALAFPEYEGPLEDDGDRRIVLGFDHNGNLWNSNDQEETMMPDMTDEEYDALDEYYTRNPPKVDPAKRGGIFTRQRELLDSLDQVAADYIRARAEADHKLPVQIIGELVREKISQTT
jgi:hypothetical protein